MGKVEDSIKKGVNTPYFKKLTIVEMHNLQDGRVWEIKLKSQEETIFAKIFQVKYVANIPHGQFDVITNMFEVDENGEKPIIIHKDIFDSDIEGAHLTGMS